MRYWQSYRFVFNNPNWITNLALVAVCSIIPVIGPIVLIGYCFEVIDELLRRRQRERGGASPAFADLKGEEIMDALPAEDDHVNGWYPDFNFNRFTEYLTRGIWPFLVKLVIGFVIGMVGSVVLMMAMMIAGFAAGAAQSPRLLFVLYGFFMLAYLFVMTVVGILTTPLYLRAGLSCDFASAFSMAFFRDFMKRVGKEVVLAELFLMATGTLLGIGGLALCFVGVYPAMALMVYAQHYLDYQFYELYLQRGGVPVERKQPSPSVAEDYRDEEPSSSHVMRPRPEDRFTDVKRRRKDRLADE